MCYNELVKPGALRRALVKAMVTAGWMESRRYEHSLKTVDGGCDDATSETSFEGEASC
jgi:hypothetical protein